MGSTAGGVETLAPVRFLLRSNGLRGPGPGVGSLRFFSLFGFSGTSGADTSLVVG